MTHTLYHLQGEAMYIPDLGILLQRIHIQGILKIQQENSYLRLMIQGLSPIDIPVRKELLDVHLQELFMWLSGASASVHHEQSQKALGNIHKQEELEMILKASESHTDTMAIFNRPQQKESTQDINTPDHLYDNNDKKNIPPHLFDLS